MSDDEGEGKQKAKSIKPAEIKINDAMDVIEKRAKEVDTFLSKNCGKDAVVVAITDPPLGSKNDAAKDVGFCLISSPTHTHALTVELQIGDSFFKCH
jgi:phosphopantetheine adenylyltransferase